VNSLDILKRTELHLGTRAILLALGDSPFAPSASDIQDVLGVGENLAKKIRSEVESEMKIIRNRMKIIPSASKQVSMVPLCEGKKEEEKVFRYEIAPEAEKHLERLNGVRGSLRDLLRQYVSPKKQLGVVGSVEMMKTGARPGLFRQRDGRQIPVDEWGAVTAAAINRVLAEGLKPADDPVRLIRRAINFESQYWNPQEEPEEIPDSFNAGLTKGERDAG
jgi:hypothetical protein